MLDLGSWGVRSWNLRVGGVEGGVGGVWKEWEFIVGFGLVM